ncbi:TAF5 RNA polymerase II [Paragonimus skrjabini miyazakii]|uniref:Cilia- and flagella-associated protein 44 n=1 Tax=Paragonimus skrjabini miyazakii TaxID=59628 RepID=A0A8S9YVB3_9TREM|nr:TAF5 RNA polymerase II [Paragonimus skrjabini miyazakii]
MSQEAFETEEDAEERSESNIINETTEQSDSFPIPETADDESAESLNIEQSDDQPTGSHELPVPEKQYNNNANDEKKKEEEDNVENEEAVDSNMPKDARNKEAESAPEGITIISESDSKVVNDVEKTDVTEADSKKPTGESEIDEGDQDEDVYSESEAEVFRAELKPKRVVDPEFTYNLEELVSRPTIAEDSGIPENLLTLHHSFGFDALRRENLQLLEPDIICYLAGNYLEILNLATEEKKYIRTIGGVGVGAFSVHPKKTEIAIAEKNDNPLVCIYRYPNLDLYRVLLEGTQKEYAACQFSPDGEMIATVGSDPDYMLTLWEWRNEQIVLRAKAFSQDIYRVSWSADLAGILTTAGAGHIRFWKMANTFTGLKLQGKLGKFGKTELSDIEGFVILPDGKVLTGCAWGNLLVWDGDLIKVQISRKNKRPCHTGLIMHIVMDEGELMTVGQDGWIRTWDFETVDTAECLEEGGIFELEPMNELQVSPQAKLNYLVKVQGEESTLWYAQDADGALWKLDLSFSHTSLAPESLKRFHSDAIRDCVTSPFAYTVATIGLDGMFISDIYLNILFLIFIFI